MRIVGWGFYPNIIVLVGLKAQPTLLLANIQFQDRYGGVRVCMFFVIKLPNIYKNNRKNDGFNPNPCLRLKNFETKTKRIEK